VAESAPTPAFTLRVDDDLELVLREVWTAVPLARVIADHLEHLRAWEPWAQGEQTLEGLTAFTRSQLAAWLDGRSVPTAVRWRGELVGAVGASVDAWTGTAELGYWVAADAQGHGVVTRSCAALVDHLVAAHGVGRVEARCCVGNTAAAPSPSGSGCASTASCRPRCRCAGDARTSRSTGWRPSTGAP